MADKRIEDATPDTQVTGVEKLPVSDGGVAKCMTVAQVKDYTLAQIASIASASGIDISADGVYLLKGGALKPVSSETLATAVLDYGFGKVAVASMNGNEIVGVKDSTAQKTITVTQLKTWLQANMTVTTDIDIGAKDAAGALSANDLLVIAQSGTNKKLTLTTLAAYVCSAFKDYVTSLTAVTTIANTDVIYLINGTEAKKCTIAKLMEMVGGGNVIGPDTTTNNKVPQWDSAAKTLKDGLEVQGTVRASGTASSGAIPTEAAVRAAIAEVQSPVSSVNTKTGAVALTGSDIPVSGSDSTKLDVKIQNIVAASTDFVGATSDTPGTHGLVPAPSIANRNKFLKADGTWAEVPSDVSGPATTTANNIPQWDSTNKKLKDGKAVATSIRTGTTEGEVTSADDAHVPTEKAVRVALDSQALDFTKVFPYCGNDSAKTAGKIPVWGADQTANYHPLADGVSLETAIPESTTDTAVLTTKAVKTALDTKPTATLATSVSAQSTDAQVPSAKAVNDFVASKVLFEKISGTLTNTTGTLENHAVQRFSISTGTNYTLALPSAVSERSREFYVVFSQAPAAEGSSATMSEITFANPTGETVEIHGKNGVLTDNKLQLTWNATGRGNAFHVYHFLEDSSQLWCINEFDVKESGGGGGSGVGVQFENEFFNVSTGLGGVSSVLIHPMKMASIVYDGTVATFTMSFSADGLQSGNSCRTIITMENSHEAAPTITGVDDVVLPSGISSFGELFTANKITIVEVVVMCYTEEETNVAMPIVVLNVQHFDM